MVLILNWWEKIWIKIENHHYELIKLIYKLFGESAFNKTKKIILLFFLVFVARYNFQEIVNNNKKKYSLKIS